MLKETGDGVRRWVFPFGSPGLPERVLMSGRVMGGVGTEGREGLARRGVSMGMTDMFDRPTDRFGMEPIPTDRQVRG